MCIKKIFFSNSVILEVKYQLKQLQMLAWKENSGQYKNRTHDLCDAMKPFMVDRSVVSSNNPVLMFDSVNEGILSN